MVSGITNDTTAAAATMKKATGMNKDDFLTLFVTQLKNQDPLKPQDSNEFIAQLAQLTQVEQSYNTNTNLANLLTAINGMSSLNSVSFIGKEVSASSNQINLVSGKQALLGYRLPANADQVKVEIRDGRGVTIRTLTAGKTQAGDGTIGWDGKSDGGTQAPAGSYSFSVTGITGDTKFDGSPQIIGKVDGINVEGQEPVITIGGISVPLSQILSVKGVT
ncbi:MAG: flagellar hook assembly protein FlgD [Desulfuromonadales bacterium]|nr:MAG: flagellar hook assembly protein FlgD [Desulfuromonadales bacterium]